MQEIDQLGAEIDDAWSRAEYRTEEFSSIAQAALGRRAFPASLSTERIVRWLALSPQVPHQPPGAIFGEPPVLVYATPRFYIELLFWTDGTTAIHQHSFSGAFQVILGGSIHTSYRFERTEAISRELLLGKLTAGRSELLRVGDVRAIVSGDRLIHSLFHLDRPSLTLVVRTRHDEGTTPQYSYLHPGIAYDPFIPGGRASRLTRLLDVLDPRSPQATQFLADLTEHADLEWVVVMLTHWFHRHPVDPGLSEALLAVIARRHAGLATSLRLAFDEARRQALIIHRRRSHHRADLRFFLALLLNVGDRARILQFVEQQAPGEDPIERVMTWIEDLIAAPATDPDRARGTGRFEYDLGEAELKVLQHLLRQRSPDEIVALLDDEYDDVEPQRSQILDLCTALTDSALLRPLFQMAS
jgi:hypothetical protein